MPSERFKKELSEILTDILAVSGSAAQLAALLGLRPEAVYSWVRIGYVSAIGAKLIEASAVFSRYFEAGDIRPDIDPGGGVWEYTVKDMRYRRARKKQKTYEKGTAFKDLRIPLTITEEWLGER